MQSAHPGVVWLGKFIRQRRETKGLKLKDLADQTTKSVSALEKVENGSRSPGLEYLTEIFDALGIALNYRTFIVNGMFPGLMGRLYGPSSNPPTEQEKAYLEAIRTPAAYVYLPSGDVVATNDAFRRAMPRLNDGTNLIEWMFTDPISKIVLPDWEELAHALAFGLKWLGPGALSPARIEEIRAKCSAANPRFDTMWKTDLPNPDRSITEVQIRNVVRGGINRYAINISTHTYPGRRNWMTYAFVPTVMADSPAA